MTQDKTRKSIYPPIEVTLNEETYHSRKFARSVMLEKAVHEKEIELDDEPKEGEETAHELKKWNAYCSWMLVVFGVPKEKMEEVDFSEVEDAFMAVKTELLMRQGNRMEKHVSEVKAVTDKITGTTGKMVEQTEKAEDTVKNAKGPGKTK